jgi:uncharacterized phage-associated protein
MVVSAHDVVAELRRRLPGLPIQKAHKLLYLCQGHHLAATGEPLFYEGVVAWDRGPVVADLWRDEKCNNPPPERHDLDNAQLNTVGYVVSRYGALTGRELEGMSHAERPWRYADANRSPGTSAPIRNEWLLEYFRTDGAPDDGVDAPPLDSAELAGWLGAGQSGDDGEPDTVDGLRALARRG